MDGTRKTSPKRRRWTLLNEGFVVLIVEKNENACVSDWSKTNHHAGDVTYGTRKNIFRLQFGELIQLRRRGMFSATEEDHANLGLCRRLLQRQRVIAPDRKGGRSNRRANPEGSQHTVARPPRLNKYQGRRKPSFFIPLYLKNHSSIVHHHDVSQNFDTTVSPSLRPSWRLWWRLWSCFSPR